MGTIVYNSHFFISMTDRIALPFHPPTIEGPIHSQSKVIVFVGIVILTEKKTTHINVDGVSLLLILVVTLTLTKFLFPHEEFSFYPLSARFFVFATITGFDHLTPEVHREIPVSDDFLSADANKCVPAANVTMLFGLLSTEDATSQLFETSSTSGPQVCVLEGNPSRSEERDFGTCVAKRLTCDNPTRLVDEENGNVAVFCNETTASSHPEK